MSYTELATITAGKGKGSNPINKCYMHRKSSMPETTYKVGLPNFPLFDNVLV